MPTVLRFHTWLQLIINIFEEVVVSHEAFLTKPAPMFNTHRLSLIDPATVGLRCWTLPLQCACQGPQLIHKLNSNTFIKPPSVSAAIAQNPLHTIQVEPTSRLSAAHNFHDMASAEVISSFIEGAPPGELNEVVNSIKALTSDSEPSLLQQPKVKAAFRRYNESQLACTKLPGGSQYVSTCPSFSFALPETCTACIDTSRRSWSHLTIAYNPTLPPPRSTTTQHPAHPSASTTQRKRRAALNHTPTTHHTQT